MSPNRARLSPQIEEQIVTYYQYDNLNAFEIADMLNVKRFEVYRVLRRLGVQIRQGRPSFIDRMSADDLDLFKSQYDDQSLTLKQIAEYWHTNMGMVMDWVKKLDFERRVPHVEHIHLSQLDEAVQLYKDGATLSYIKITTGVQQHRLYQELTIRRVDRRWCNQLAIINRRRAIMGLPPLAVDAEPKPEEEK